MSLWVFEEELPAIESRDDGIKWRSSAYARTFVSARETWTSCPWAGASACSAHAPTPWANSLLELEHSRRQVALTGIGKDCHDGLALVLGTLRELACSPHGGTR